MNLAYHIAPPLLLVAHPFQFSPANDIRPHFKAKGYCTLCTKSAKSIFKQTSSKKQLKEKEEDRVRKPLVLSVIKGNEMQ